MVKGYLLVSLNKDEANNFWVLLFSLQYHFENKWKWKDITADNWNDIETLICSVLTKKDNNNTYKFNYFKLAETHGTTSDLCIRCGSCIRVCRIKEAKTEKTKEQQ